MSNSMRLRHGGRFQFFAVDTDTVIEIGDLVYYDATNDEILPASSLADAGTPAGNQEAIHDLFVGMAMQASGAGDTKDVRVCIEGVVEMDCASASFAPNDFVGVAENAGGDGLEDQKVIGVATANLSIGRPYDVQASVTKVLVKIKSSYEGGVQVAA